MAKPSNILRNLPRVDDVMSHPLLAQHANGAAHTFIRDAAREALSTAREQAMAGENPDLSVECIAAKAANLLQQKQLHSLRHAINATGVILHTGLGRAPFSQAAQDALVDTVSGYCNIQADVGSGERMNREVHVESLFRRITGAEAAVVVNNNAAATVLVLNTLAVGKEVIVSRGELVEIGGAFRIPDIMKLSNCRLVEVGCTNRTHLRDYKNALSPETALLLVVHPSNYRITGFTSQPPLHEIAALAHENGIMCAHDLGSGALFDLQQFGLPHEPNVPESFAAGADVVFFSGDKLIGGPQCGIILGKADVLEKMRKNPFYRTFRVDKMTLSALEGTLRLFLDRDMLLSQHRLMSMLTCPVKELQKRAKKLAQRINEQCGDRMQAAIRESESEIGGGSLAGYTVPTITVAVQSQQIPAGELAHHLRAFDAPIFTRVQDDAVLLDMRTILPGEEDSIVRALKDYKN